MGPAWWLLWGKVGELFVKRNTSLKEADAITGFSLYLCLSHTYSLFRYMSLKFKKRELLKISKFSHVSPQGKSILIFVCNTQAQIATPVIKRELGKISTRGLRKECIYHGAGTAMWS